MKSNNSFSYWKLNFLNIRDKLLEEMYLNIIVIDSKSALI